jgi:uncharacterized membrane protein YfcA
MRVRRYDVCMELLLIGLAAAAASAATLISGFGLSTALVPVFALYFPLPLAISAVAVVHLLNSIFKVGIMRNEVDWPVAFRFGLPAAAAALLGATLLGALGEAEPLARYSIGESSFQITPLKLVVGGVILALVALELSPRATTLHISPSALPFGGILSGFFGGLTGNQGVLRSAFLLQLRLSPARFAATGAAGAAFVDLARLAVYGSGASAAVLESAGPLRDALIVATLAAFAGALGGRQLIRVISGALLRRFVAASMLAVATLMVTGIV